MADQTCKTCRFVDTSTQQPACKRFPPQTHFIVVLRPKSPLTPHILEPKEEQRSAFPAVALSWSCGEYAPRLEVTS